MAALVDHSVRVLLANQAPTGAFIASPNLAQYRYAWLRDGTFCAEALSRFGRVAAARAYHDWASRTILRYASKLQACIAAAMRGERPAALACFHCRFTVDGDEVSGSWGVHQLDGLGTWLWAVDAFAQRQPDGLVSTRWLEAADRAAAYLAAMWRLPCSDWWEEGDDNIHTSTLAAVAAGLEAHGRLAGDTSSAEAAGEIRAYIRECCVIDGTFVKSSAVATVDASLLSLFVPYEVVRWSDPTYQATVRRVIADLATPIGLHRYRSDSFYGGGEWLLLTAWLGWAQARAGEAIPARQIARWIEAQAGPTGMLPEQVPHRLFEPAALPAWTQRWGPIASPLLWSHAMYLILVDELRESGPAAESGGLP